MVDRDLLESYKNYPFIWTKINKIEELHSFTFGLFKIFYSEFTDAK